MPEHLNEALIIIITYLIGSIPFGLIFSKISGIKDIREHGSGNIGATNVLRVAGPKWAILTLLFDFGKGALMTIIAIQIYGFEFGIIVGGASIIGHIFPIWLKLKGGKGVATSLAVIVMLNYKIAIFVIVTWLVVFAISRISSLSAICSFFLFPIYSCFLQDNSIFIYFSIITSITIITKHHNNIYRLIKGNET